MTQTAPNIEKKVRFHSAMLLDQLLNFLADHAKQGGKGTLTMDEYCDGMKSIVENRMRKAIMGADDERGS
jgi:hypothetical protein